jgi:iron complex transport system substrate-binding protein
MTARRAAGGLLITVGLAASVVAAAEPRVVVDAAGRQVAVPARIERVFAAGPPATVFVYTLAPDTLLGWYRPLTTDERDYIPARYAELPTLGKLTGRSNTPNLEVVRAARPDVIVDYGAVGPQEAALADRVQRATGIPYVLLDGSLAAIPRAYQAAGELLGVAGRAAELSRYAERELADVSERVARVPAERRPRVYYARPPDGLGTELIESLQTLGAVNVATGYAAPGALVRVSVDQVVAWHPDVIVTIDTAFSAAVGSDPAWRQVKAVRDGRVYLAPLIPFPWLDLPPSVNRLAGLRWLGRALYPELFRDDSRAATLAFYRLFYHQAPTERQLGALLGGG